ncbi:MAG: CHAT domain-containing protein [Henriciella sp.]|nr:CHAT domain-containing protein [Henriciella sp.]
MNFESIQFVSCETAIPWELMRVVDRNDAVEPEFLAVLHSVGRWFPKGNPPLRQQRNISKMRVGATDYKNVKSKRRPKELPGALEERDFLARNFKVSDVPLLADKIIHLLTEEDFDLLHLACHGDTVTSQASLTRLVMENTPENDIVPTMINEWSVRRKLRQTAPVIFLNACQSAASGRTLSMIAGFPSAFVESGASALIAPLWSVGDDAAHQIAQTFYEELKSSPGKTVGQVLKNIRAEWQSKKSLTYLAYVLYGDPDARIKFRNKIQSHGGDE